MPGEGLGAGFGWDRVMASSKLERKDTQSEELDRKGQERLLVGTLGEHGSALLCGLWKCKRLSELPVL